MAVVEMRFLSGRFHATPWDRHVNEGVVEWPPSPWRILRALIATWYLKARDDVEEDVLRCLIEKLSVPPSYHLPPAVAAHTRHYMPLYRSPIDHKTAKIFDTFVRLDPETPLTVLFDKVALTESENRALDTLLSRMGYLGRAESWTDARLVDSTDVVPNACPIEDSATQVDGHESLRLLAPSLPGSYVTWRDEQLRLIATPKSTGVKLEAGTSGTAPKRAAKSPKRGVSSLDAAIPANLFEALQVDTNTLKDMGWSQPPGSIWVTYSRPKDVFSRVVNMTARASGGRPCLKPTVAQYLVVSNAPPRLTEAVSLAERVHVSLVKRSDGSSVFTGCDDKGEPLNGNSHAYILPESRMSSRSGIRGEVTHVTVFAPMGFGPCERGAIDGLKKVWGRGGNGIQLVLLGVGSREDFAGTPSLDRKTSSLGESDVWISRTPFVPTRHPKYTRAGKAKLDASGMHIGSPVHDLRRLLACSGFPPPVEIQPVQSTDLAGRQTRWIEFRRERSAGGGQRATNSGYGFMIKFPERVAGPIALGYGAHFGLGQFEPGR